MAQKKQTFKKILFSLIVLALIFIFATVVLEIFEKSGIISTEREDDRVAYPPAQLLRTEKGPNPEDTPSPNAFIRVDKDSGIRNYYEIADPYMVKSRFSVRKPRKTFRMFITGGSFAMGYPYNNQGQEEILPGSIASWVRAELQMRFPSLKIEIINAATGGQNSFRVRSIVETLSKVDADLILLATGNNEGYVPETRFNQALHKWIVYRAMKKSLLPEMEPEKRSYFSPQTAPAQVICSNYKTNIHVMIESVLANKNHLALATLPINLKYSGPDPHATGDGLAFPEKDKWIEAGLKLQKAGKFTKAIDKFTKSEHQAYAAKLIGECFEALGNGEKAREFYKVYAENNPLNRMRPSFNQFIRKVADENPQVFLVDLERQMEAISPIGIPGDLYFTDYCHLDWEGYKKIAEWIVDVLIEKHLIRGRTEEPLRRPSTEEMIDRFGFHALIRSGEKNTQ